MKKEIATLVERKTDEERLKSSYRRLVMARLPVNLYSARGAHMQRRAATLLHGMDAKSIQWEEFDCTHLADDERGDHTSLLLGGAIGGVALTNFSHTGLLAAAGTGTLFLSNLEKLSAAGERVLCRIIETGHYTPVGDPYPRPVCCRLIVGTHRPLIELARRMFVGGGLARLLGSIQLRAEDVLSLLETKKTYSLHPVTLAAAS